MSKKRVKIEVPSEAGYSLVAIASSENDYRLSWLINKYTGFKLARRDDLELSSKEGQKQYYPRYTYLEGEEAQAMLVSNRPPETAPLIKSRPKIDFLLVIYNDADGQKAKQAISELNGKPGLIACFKLGPAGLNRQERDRLTIIS